MNISDLSVQKVSSNKGRPFILDHHYSGSCHGGPMCWGCFYDDDLVGVLAFATPISEAVRRSIWKENHQEEMKHRTTELHRLVTLDETPHNTESWFISRALRGLKKYKPKYNAVISFADTTEGHTGTIYQATNAIYYGMTGESTFYRDQEGNLRAPRQSGVNITKSMAEKRGWVPEKRKSKHRYLFLISGNRYSKKDLKSMLCIESKNYPK
jgi:hypothetical protein